MIFSRYKYPDPGSNRAVVTDSAIRAFATQR